MIIPASYSRYSTDNQREESIEDQQSLTGKRCEQEGWPSPLLYSDHAMSGQSKDRQGFDKLIADAEKKLFNVLLVTALSRLGRDSAEREMVIRRLEFWGIRIIATSEGYDTSLPLNVRKMHRGMSGIKDEAFIDDVARETHRGMTGVADRGFNAGGKAYGYKHIPEEHPTKTDKFGRPEIIGVNRVIDEEQAEIIRRIFTWYSKGKTPFWIAGQLNEEGIPAPNGRSWTRSSIYPDKRSGIGMLSNELYNGKYIWNRSKWIKNPDTGKRKRLERPESEWIIHDKPELTIIDDDLWQAVQARIQSSRNETIAKKLKGKGAGGRAPKYLLSGLLKCGVCGGNITIITGRTQRYGCGRRKDGGQSVCSNNLSVPRLVAEQRLLKGIKDELVTDEAIKIFRAEASKVMREIKKHDPTKKARQKLAQLETSIQNMVKAIQEGAYSKTLQEALTGAENQRDKISQEIASQAQAASALPDILPNMEQIYSQRVTALETALTNDVTEAREHLRIILGDSIPLYPREDGYLEAELKTEIGDHLKLTAGSDIRQYDNVGSGGLLQPLSARIRLK